jgi:hypothetical protein
MCISEDSIIGYQLFNGSVKSEGFATFLLNVLEKNA